MKRFLFATVLAATAAFAQAASIEGKWQTKDESGKAKAIVQITKTGNTFTGRIVSMLKVRGYLGISALGRTQTWTRVN